MNMNTWAEELMNSPRRYAIPIMTHPGIEMINKQVIDAVTNGQVHADAIIALNQKYPADASTVIMDLTVEAEAFGAEIVFKDDEVPSIVGRLVSNGEEIEALQIPDVNAGRISEYLKANQIVAQSITDKPVFGGAIGPFSLAGRLYDMSEIMMGIYIEPDAIKNLLSKCTQFLITYIRAIKATGVSGVIIAEPAAGLLSNDDAKEFSSHYVTRIVEVLQDENFMIVLHNCGNTGMSTDAMTCTGAKGVHFGNKIDMVEALRQSPTDILIMGNLDPVGIFKQATPEEVAAATQALLASTQAYKNFIISTGCDVPPGVSEANIQAFYNQL